MANQYIKGDIVMGSKDIPNIANYADLLIQPIRKLYITVEVIDDDNNTIETIQGLSTGGNISVSGSSLIRRTGHLSFVLFDYLLPKKDSLLWMTNKIRVYAGLENLASSDGSLTHFCLGTFYITEPQIEISRTSRSINIELQDMMMRWEQEQLENKIKIEAGTPLHTAVASLMSLYGEFNTNIEFTDLKVPYTLEFNEGESVLEILQKLRDLYMDWECYYDIDGTFVFRKMKIQREGGEPVAWIFDKDKGTDLITIFRESFTYKDVKNRIVVIGSIDERTGITPRAEASITLESSPFHANEIGVKTKVITESSYKTQEQCEARARYELFKSSTFQERIDINTIPIYYLDVNDIIEIRNHVTQEYERYIIDSISIGLTIEEEMGLNCHKLYYDHFETNSNIDKYRQMADVVIDGIMNKGWLSIPEQRIKDYYGLEGDGSKLIIRFEYDSPYGTTAYTTGYIGYKTQVLTVDLADFNPSTGDSGYNKGHDKSEYSDRILGHEMVHVVMNNAMGVEKTSILPEWFKEGVAEFIHGADERLKNSIVDNGKLSDSLIDALVSRATDLLNGGRWQSVSDNYSAGYVIIKYLQTKIKSAGKTMRDLMHHIKQSNSNTPVQDAIVANTNFITYKEFVDDFSANAKRYIKYGMKLNIGSDEVDTGSVAGSDHGGTDLNAEQIFDNSRAIIGVPATGFKVVFERP